MAQQTAVQWLKQQYIERGETLPSGVFQEALELEKEQMISFGSKMQLVQHVSYDGDVTFCFNPEENYINNYQNK